jgi:endonuclease/exonuclease/phosphatase family metal-dependent hydrolase
MRVVTWNIQRARPNPDGPAALDRVIEGLRSLDADVCAVQELDRGRRRSGGVDQPERLAEALGGRLAWAPTVRGGDGEYGIAMMVAGEIVGSEAVPLGGTREPRVLLVAEVEVRGQRWTIGCTHLSRRVGLACRQLVRVVDAMAERPAPRVLLGDLNLVPSQVLPWSTPEGYQLVTGPPTHSTRQTHPTRRIDHILLAGAVATRATVHRFDVSDHCAVTADLTNQHL